MCHEKTKEITVEIQSCMERLHILLPLINKVHGIEHPELLEVHKIYQQLCPLLLVNNKKDTAKNLIQQLARLTNHYAIPPDACPAFQEAYLALDTVCKLALHSF